MLTSSKSILENEVNLCQHLMVLFEQYPGHVGQLRALRRSKRRSEYVHVVTEIGTPNITMCCRQLSRVPDTYYRTGSGARVLRAGLEAAEAAGAEPVLFELFVGQDSRAAVISLRGRKLDAGTKELIRARSTLASSEATSPEAVHPELLWRSLALLSDRVLALEKHLASLSVAVPEGYQELCRRSNEVLRCLEGTR